MKKFLCTILSFTIMLSTLFCYKNIYFTVTATQDRSDNFNTNYSLTGDGPTDMLNIAFAQIGRTGTQFGYSENWCADFVSDCAELAGQSAAIPRTGAVSHEYTDEEKWYGLKQTIMNAGGIIVNTPIPGDIVIWKHTGLSHVEIVSKNENGVVYSIGGNNGSDSYFTSYVAGERKVSTIGTVDFYIRPNYTGTKPPVTTDTPNNESYTYFPKCNPGFTSIVEALKSIGAESSYDYRKTIAALNGISDYSGTYDQNTSMIRLLEQGKLIKSKVRITVTTTKTTTTTSITTTITQSTIGGYWYCTYFPKCNPGFTSIVEALKSIGAESSYDYRKTIAALNGISNYSGTSDQNTSMISLLEQGKLIKSKVWVTVTTTKPTTTKPTTTTTKTTTTTTKPTTTTTTTTTTKTTTTTTTKPTTTTTTTTTTTSTTRPTTPTVTTVTTTKPIITTELSLSIPDTSVNAGETFVVPVELQKNPGISSLGFEISYDSNYIEFVDGVNGAVMGDSYFECVEGQNIIYIQWVNFDKNIVENGNILELAFKAKENVDSVNTEIKIICDDGDATTFDNEIVKMNVKNGTVQISSEVSVPGDVNEDNVVDLKDVILIRRYIAGGWENKLNIANADVNDDSAVDLKDVIYIRRYIAGGWDIELK